VSCYYGIGKKATTSILLSFEKNFLNI